MYRMIVLLSLLVILGPLSAVPEQQVITKQQDLYEPIPAEKRKSLKDTTERLVAAQKRGDWEAVWDLYGKRPEENKQEFLKKMKHRRRLREFQASAVYFYPPGESWIIQGCGAFEGDPQGKGRSASIHAAWKESRWYVSPVVIALPEGNEKGMKTRECSILSQSPAVPNRKSPI